MEFINKEMQQRFCAAKKEFINIVETYMLPLFDTRGNLKCVEKAVNNTELISLGKNSQGITIRFYPCIANEKRQTPFYCESRIYSSEALKKPAIHILRELLKVSEYDYGDTFSIKRNYGRKGARNLSYKNRTLDLAFELGMCQWLAHDMKNAITLHTIICRMIEWSSRTYEGKNVPFGIIVDFNDVAEDNAADYVHFLEKDSSAVFTDGIFSAILLESVLKPSK